MAAEPRQSTLEVIEGAGNYADVTVRVCPNPVLVIGSPRSGTSVVPWSLAHHWDFWTSEETEFVHGLFGKNNAGAVFEQLRNRPQTFLSQYNIDRKEFFGALGLGINALISSRSEGCRWIDQSPGYTTMVWILADMFPGAYFLHILRDGRSVVSSMLNFGERAGGQAWAADFETAVRTWKEYVEFALDFAAHNPGRTLTVKNEDLVERPEEEFAKILSFLRARPNEAPARFFRTSRVNSSFGPLVWGSGRQANPPPPVTTRRTAADAWREWSPEQRETFDQIAGDLIARLGYPTDLDAD
jgi:Sulfotransferase family